MKKSLIVLAVAFLPAISLAGTAENVDACVKQTKAFTGIGLDPYSASYESNIIYPSIASWPNAKCEVKLARVYNLTVNGRIVVYRWYAGKEAFDLNKTLEADNERAISQLRTRISLLESRQRQISDRLQSPNPNFEELIKASQDAIRKSGATSSEDIAPKKSAKKPIEKGIKIANDAPVQKAKGASIVAPIEKDDKAVKETAEKTAGTPLYIPSDPKTKYFILEKSSAGTSATIINKRVGSSGTSYAKRIYNCQENTFKYLGDGDTIEQMNAAKPWAEMVPLFEGSISYYVGIEACK